MMRRHAKFVFAEMAAVGQLLFAFDFDERRHSVSEYSGKNGQIGVFILIVRSKTENSRYVKIIIYSIYYSLKRGRFERGWRCGYVEMQQSFKFVRPASMKVESAHIRRSQEVALICWPLALKWPASSSLRARRSGSRTPLRCVFCVGESAE